MIVQRIYTYPAVGRESELRAALDERVRTAPSRKVRAALLQQLLPTDGPVFVTAILHDSLGAFEEYRARNLADPSAQTFIGKVGAASRRPLKIELFDVLLSPGGDAATPKYTHLVRVFPAPGQDAAMRAVLEDLGRRRQAESRPRFGVLRQLFAPDGSVFAIRDVYRSLAEFEDIVREAPASIQAAAARAGDISRASLAHELCEVLVPLPV